MKVAVFQTNLPPNFLNKKMKNLLIVCFLALLFSFVQRPENRADDYPKEFIKVLNAHGGMKKWKKEKTLVFEIPKGDTKDVHTVDLDSRKDKVTSAKVDMGFDGTEAWAVDKAGDYKGNPYYSHNLMFYFYAMPFVLADNGIQYSEVPNLVVEGKSYPGVKITFASTAGVSSQDEYHLHYDPQTYQMRWLVYTATFGADKKSDRFGLINYSDWAEVNGVLLPKTLTWYKYEDRQVKEVRNSVTFENISLSKTPKPASFYAKPGEAKVYSKK